MGVIIFVIGTALGDLDELFSLGKMFEEVVIKELGSVVIVEAKQGERKEVSISLICSKTSVIPYSIC